MDFPEIGLIIFIAIFIALGFVACQNSEKRNLWLKQHCHKIGEMSSDTSTGIGIGANGYVSVVPVFISGKTGYQCDNGLQYWE